MLVDEYQDTNRVQYRLVNQLAARAPQPVRRRRSQPVDLPLARRRRAATSSTSSATSRTRKVVKLDRNYRSTQRILSGASAVVEHNRGRPRSACITERGEGERIVAVPRPRRARRGAVRGARHPRGGARATAAPSASARSSTAPTRSRGRSRRSCSSTTCPTSWWAGVRFYDRAEVKDVLCLPAPARESRRRAALRRIVNRPARGIGKTTLERAEAIARERGVALLEGAARVRGRASRGARGARGARASSRCSTRSPRELRHALPAEAIERVLERTGYLARARARGDARGRGAPREPARAAARRRGLRRRERAASPTAGARSSSSSIRWRWSPTSTRPSCATTASR